MGIGITSNPTGCYVFKPEYVVSIPNGDRHYLERNNEGVEIATILVSIPNGDRHYLEHLVEPLVQHAGGVSIPNGDRHYLEQ